MSVRLVAATLSIAAIGIVSGCGAGEEGGVAKDGKLRVSAAFYPLQFAAEQVGGAHVEVTGLTKPGGEPHDLELRPKDVAALAEASLVVYEKGFQPAVDEAVANEGVGSALDVGAAAGLDLAAPAEPEPHAGQSGDEHAGHAGGPARDPHFWLDPVKYSAVAVAIGDRLAAIDPSHAGDYRQNAKDLAARLHALDQEFTSTLKSCANRDLVTSHAAFGYLAKRYGLHQEGITGISPEAEPSAAQMKQIVEHVREHGVRTIYSETLVSPALADTIAKESGATVAVLDPIEGITAKSHGKDYFEVMRSNLSALKVGQQCA